MYLITVFEILFKMHFAFEILFKSILYNTVQDLALKFPGLSRTKPFFQEA